jgi:hypothetical protein
MIGNYLSTSEAHCPQLAPVSEAVLATTGGLARPTMLVFELRRLPTRFHHAVAGRRAGVDRRTQADLDSVR